MRKKMLVSVCAYFLALLAGSAQTSTITGKVVDDKGAPIPAASIVEKGTAIEFTLTLPPEITMTESIRVRCRGRVVRVDNTAFEGRTAVAAQIEKYEFLSEHNA